MSEKAFPSISVFFPAYNDANTIGRLVTEALALLPDYTDDYEVIVINDGSRDNTKEVLDQLAAKYKAVRIIEHAVNRGYGAALRSGFEAATKDLVFYTDGDGQYDVHDISRLFPLLITGVDVVNGYKLDRNDKVNRKIIGGLYNQLTHFLFSLPIRDVDCDFRLLRRSMLTKVELFSDSGSICVELIDKLNRAGAVFREVGVNHYARQYGRSQFFTFRRISKTLADISLLWLKIRFREKVSG
jgi:glycosyltransferase involved in cell wall biosynthesis